MEEDFGVWKSYAYQNGIHAAVVTFLEINPDWFYAIRTTVEGTQYVTARGWEDLSRIISVYEKKKFKVDKRLVQQYITNSEVAAKFSIYYDLFQKYQSSYQVEDILKGISGQELQKRAAGARQLCHKQDHLLPLSPDPLHKAEDILQSLLRLLYLAMMAWSALSFYLIFLN